MTSRLPTTTIAIALACAGVARAQFDPEHVAPRSTVVGLLPEKMPALESPAYFDELAKANQLLQRGRYRAALHASYRLPAETPAVEVALVRGAACAAIGADDAARAALESHASNSADPRAAVVLSRLDVARGRYDDAIKRLTPLVETGIPARVCLGDAQEKAGDTDAAARTFAPLAIGESSVLAKFRAEGALGFESAEDLTLAAHAIDRWAAITKAYGEKSELHGVVLSMFVAAYDTVDREYWPARVAAASYLADHGNAKQAKEELDAANEMNPNAVEVNVLLGRLSQKARDERSLAMAIDALRDVDPDSFEAEQLEVALSLSQRSFASALAGAKRGVERQPRNLAALGTLASVYAATGDKSALAETFARVDAIDANDAIARTRAAGVMSSIFYDSAGAVELLRAAVERAPWWTEPQHALGNALIQDGEEDEARAVLDRAQSIDPYNLETVNYLRVLDEMSKFKVHEGRRFTFKYAEIDDPIVPLCLAPQMDAMYDDLVKRYGFEPPKRPIVEVFPDAQSFSVRTAGVPGLETYGASLGRVMTVVAPRAGETLGPFNWARVMRHEFTHTVNLMYTHGRVPRWFTEGLAVWEEKVPYRFAYVPPAWYELAMKGDIPEPRNMRQGINEMGYMAGFWITRYIDENLGWPKVLALLDAYRDGKGDDDAFRAATGMNCAEFDVKFDAWAKEQVKDWGYDEKTAGEADKQTKVAEKLTQGGQWNEAAEAWKGIAKLQPMNPLPPRRLAGIYLRQDKPAEALPFLIQTLPIELQDSRFAKRIARIYDAQGDAADAMKYAEHAMSIDPYDPDCHDLLSKLHEKAGDAAKAKQAADLAKLLRERARP